MRFDRTLLAPAVIFVLALAIRLAYVYDMREFNPLFSNPVMDEAIYDSWARGILSGEFPGNEPFFRAPLYYYLLALVYKLFGPGYLLPRILQALLGSLTCILIYELGRMIFDRRTGLLAGVAAAVYWVLIYFDGELLITSLAVFLNVALLLSLYAVMGSPGGGGGGPCRVSCSACQHLPAPTYSSSCRGCLRQQPSRGRIRREKGGSCPGKLLERFSGPFWERL